MRSRQNDRGEEQTLKGPNYIPEKRGAHPSLGAHDPVLNNNCVPEVFLLRSIL